MQPIERLIHMRSKKAIFRAFPAPPYGIGGGGGCGAGSGTSISGRGGSISGGGAGGLTGGVGCGGWVAMSFLLVASQRNKLAPVASGPSLYGRSEEHTSELQSLMRISYAVFCLKKKNNNKNPYTLYDKKHKTESNKNT